MLFLDVKDAFYNMIREAVAKANRNESDAAILKLMQRLRVPAEAMPLVIETLGKPTVLQQHGVGVRAGRRGGDFERVVHGGLGPIRPGNRARSSDCPGFAQELNPQNADIGINCGCSGANPYI